MERLAGTSFDNEIHHSNSRALHLLSHTLQRGQLILYTKRKQQIIAVHEALKYILYAQEFMKRKLDSQRDEDHSQKSTFHGKQSGFSKKILFVTKWNKKRL